jgi:hypothetical protein
MVFASLLAALLAAGPETAVSAIETSLWEAPLGCPGADWLATRIEAYLGRPLHPDELAGALERGLGGRVRNGNDGRFELELDSSDGSPRHRLADHDCQHLTDVAASLLAIAIDPLATGGPVVPLEHSEPTIPVLRPTAAIEVAPTPSVVVETPRVAPEPETWELTPVADSSSRDRIGDAPSGRLRGLLLADAGLAINVFPNLAPQVHAGVGFDVREADARVGLRVIVDGGAALAGRFRAADGRELGGDLIAWDVGLRPCVVPRWGLVDLHACAAAGAGQLRGRGVGVQNPQDVTQPWVWAGADVGVAVGLHRPQARPRVRAALFVDVGAGINIVRPNFVILDAGGGTDVSYVMPLVSGRGRLGFELGFF